MYTDLIKRSLKESLNVDYYRGALGLPGLRGGCGLCHSEMRIIRQCAQLLTDTFGPNQGRNRTLWQQLSLYTTGESCPMCMGASIHVGMGEVIFATSINQLIDYGSAQTKIASPVLTRQSIVGRIPTITFTIGFKKELLERYDPYFQASSQNPNNPAQLCPTGCVRNANNACVAGIVAF